MRSFIQRIPRRYAAAAVAITITVGLTLFLTRGASETQPAAAEVQERAAATASRANAASPQRVEQVRASPDKAASSDVFAEGGWGKAEDQFGRLPAQESNPEAPLSLNVDRQGNVYVLDQVNGRIQRFDRNGKRLPPFPTTQQTPRDLVVSPTGTLLLMDQLRDKTVAVLDPDGKLIGELPVTGKHLEEGGLATAVFADSTGVYVEKGHAMAVRVGDAAGTADPERPLLDGRPSRDGSALLSMGLIQAATGRFWVRAVDRATGQLAFMREYITPVPILSLMFLDSDASGRIYAAASVGRELPADSATGGSGGSPGLLDESVQLLCLDPTGTLRNVLTLPPNNTGDETTRPFAVRDDGTLLYMHLTAQGLQIQQYTCG